MLILTHLNRKEQMEQLLYRSTVLAIIFVVAYSVHLLS
jgi:hypothetical protein